MNLRHKIALFTFCLVLTFPLASNCMSFVLKSTTEKSIADKKEALPESELDSEDEIFELVHEFLPSFTAHFPVTAITYKIPIGKLANMPKAIVFDISIPPPELNSVA